MVGSGIEGKLSLDDLEPLNDDGSPRECACCARAEGRTPKRLALPALSYCVLDVAWPFFDAIGAPAPVAVWELGFRVAAEGWNLAVERRTNPMAKRTFIVEFGPTGNEFDATVLLEAVAGAKQDRYPDDVRLVEDVHVSATGEVWCKPRAIRCVVPSRAAS